MTIFCFIFTSLAVVGIPAVLASYSCKSVNLTYEPLGWAVAGATCYVLFLVRLLTSLGFLDTFVWPRSRPPSLFKYGV